MKPKLYFSTPILISLFVIITTVFVITYYNKDDIIIYSQILSAPISLIAVILFYVSLKSQTKQIEEQQIQFFKQFEQSKKTSRRDAFLKADDIFSKSIERACSLGNVDSLNNLEANYISFLQKDLPHIVKMTNSHDILLLISKKNFLEKAIFCFLNGAKNAYTIYFETNFDSNEPFVPPNTFLLSVKKNFLQLPFFKEDKALAISFCNFMLISSELLKASEIVTTIAATKYASDECLQDKKNFKTFISSFKKEYGYIPKIAKDFK